MQQSMPVVLPCGETMCDLCIQDILKSPMVNVRKEFMCPLCENSHDVPFDSQFPVNKLAMNLLKEKPQEFQLFKEFKAMLGKNRTKFLVLWSILKDDGIDMVKEHCLNLRMEVDLATELKIEEQSDEMDVLHVLRDEIIAEIYQYENDCINGLSKSWFYF